MSVAAAPASPKTVLLLIPNLDFGGAQKAHYYLSTELAKRYRVVECVFNTETGVAYPSTNELVNLDVPGGGSAPAKLFRFAQRCWRLYQVKKKHRVDVTVSSLEGADYVNLLAPAGDRRVTLIQGSKSANDKNRTGLVGDLRKHVLIPYLYRLAHRIVGVSSDIKRELTEDFGLPGHNISTIHNVVDMADVAAQAVQPIEPEIQAIFDAFPILITSGRLAEQKNQQPLLDVLAQMRQAGNPAKLFILGDGHLREPLLKHAHSLGLRTWAAWDKTPVSADFDVYFLGYQANPFRYLAKGTLFPFPSDWEGFSLALIEAMACDLCIASTDCPTGPRELFAPGTPAPAKPLETAEYAEFGVLLPTLDQADNTARLAVWTQTLLRLLADDTLRRRYAGLSRQRAAHFDRSLILREWPAVID